MSEMLNRLVAESINGAYPDADPGDLYQAQKELEKQVIKEVCEEETLRIAKSVQDLRNKQRFEEGMRELRTVLAQCFVLAFLVGLLVSHVYDSIKAYVYAGRSFFGLDPIVVGVVVLSLLCTGVAIWMVASKVFELYRSIMVKGGSE